MLLGTNLQYTKSFNIRIVLETIRLFGPISRGEIARRTELTAQTVTNITRRLMKAGLIFEGERVQDGRGAPSRLLRINPNGAFSIGLDLDKDHLTAVLVDLLGNPRQKISFDLHFPTPEEAMVLLEKTARELINREKISIDKIKGVGVGLPGPLVVSKGSDVIKVVNPSSAFPGWSNVPVIDLLGAKLSLPIYLENNASAAAIGELWYGAGRRIKTFFYLYFGSGLGGGLVIDGRPHPGHSGNAGEIGYYPNSNFMSHSFNVSEAHVGLHFNLPNLYKRFREYGLQATNESDLETLYQERNKYLMEWLEVGASKLAPLILAVEYILDPQSIIFGGRLPNSVMRELMERINATLPKLRIKDKTDFPELQLATVGEDAAALGVATLPIYESLAPLPNLLLKNSKESPRAFASTEIQ